MEMRAGKDVGQVQNCNGKQDFPPQEEELGELFQKDFMGPLAVETVSSSRAPKPKPTSIWMIKLPL